MNGCGVSLSFRASQCMNKHKEEESESERRLDSEWLHSTQGMGLSPESRP